MERDGPNTKTIVIWLIKWLGDGKRDLNFVKIIR